MTLPPFRQRVHTYARVGVPFAMMRTFCRFGSNLRGVARMEWLRLCPKLGPFPHTLQTFDIGLRPRVAVELLVSPALRRPERHSAQLCR